MSMRTGENLHALSVVQENMEYNTIAEDDDESLTKENSGKQQASGIKHELAPSQFSLNVIKAVVGAGSFSLPFAFYQNGIVMSVIMLCILSALSVYTGALLNYVDRRLSARYGKERGKSDLTYPDLAEYIFPDVTCSYVGLCKCFRRRRRADAGTLPDKESLLETNDKSVNQLTEYLRAENETGSGRAPSGEKEATTEMFTGHTSTNKQVARSVSAQPQMELAKSSVPKVPSQAMNGARSYSTAKAPVIYQQRSLSTERRREIFQDAAFTLTGRQASSTDGSSLSASQRHSLVPPEMFENTKDTVLRPRTKTDEQGVPASMPRPTGAQLCCYNCIKPFIACVLKLLGALPSGCCTQSVREPAKTRRNCGAGCSSTWCCCGDSYLDSQDDANFFSVVVYSGFVATSLGGCAAYVDFISSTLPTIVSGIDQFQASLIAFPVLLAMALLRSLRILAFTSIVGNISVTAGLVTVLVSGFLNNGLGMPPLWGSVQGFFRFFGSVAFLFAVHIVFYPVMQSLKDRSNFVPTMQVTYTIVTVANGVFGGLCIALFGNDTQPNVVENMEGSIYTTVVKVVLCADLLFTVPIVLAASRSLLEDSIVPSFPEECDTHVRNILRIILTVIVATIYLAIPSFSDLVTLIGGVVNCLMGFILPSVFYMRLKHIDGELTVGSLVGHSCIVVVGIIAAGASLVVTLISIVETHS
eukprot:gb/GECG01000554.1/.p1 GENE.gb/GECG01000554.1/~~gb/GECG01000554.1/.p1  ORF type:complete len:699 (+),score=49.09 gb/GECG01000554.1/:1-2097(+)